MSALGLFCVKILVLFIGCSMVIFSILPHIAFAAATAQFPHGDTASYNLIEKLTLYMNEGSGLEEMEKR